MRTVRSLPARPRYSPDRHMGGALAYLDPGSGSMLFQRSSAAWPPSRSPSKFYWRRFLVFLGIRKKDDS